MKLVFCARKIIGKGGIERVLSHRLNYFIEKFNYDITLITTDNNSIVYGKELPFYYFNPKIRMIDLSINYIEIANKNLNFIEKFFYKKKMYSKHLLMLNKVIENIQPDILISLGESSSNICYRINYPCKKILEHHFSKQYSLGLLEVNNFWDQIKVLYREYREKYYMNKYDKFLVLTNEDKENWGNNKKIEVINNPLTFNLKEISSCKNKKIISVGRLEIVKGFDILIEVWKKVNEKYKDWILEIYGEGSLRNDLQSQINSLKLSNRIILKGNEKNIKEKYLESSIYVMSSRYEGFGMVLIEAMACGLPVVSFDSPCGPKDIIRDNENGFLCKFSDINEMADKILYLIENEEKRIEMGKKSKELSFEYSEEKIMNKWQELFNDLIER